MNDWPTLDFAASRNTLLTLQLWSQIVGKVRLALTPWLNHSWHVPFYITSRGLGTSAISYGAMLFELEFDLINHRLEGRSSEGARSSFALEELSVSTFHEQFFQLLNSFGVHATIDPRPQEVSDPIPFPMDHQHADYDPARAHAHWRASVHADRVFKRFRTGFLGKASPVHLFWGAFDLAVTRFSGRRAPLHAGMPGLVRVMQEAYSHEVSSAGFWGGSDDIPQAVFYSYAYPEPRAFREAAMPEGVFYSAELGEFVLPYELVRSARDPEARLFDFLEATYAAAADLGEWDRAALEVAYGRPGLPPRPGRTA